MPIWGSSSVSTELMKAGIDHAGFFLLISSFVRMLPDHFINPTIVLIIPIQGLIVSIFLLAHGERATGPNFFLGLMLLVLSLFSLFQQITLPDEAGHPDSFPYGFQHELMICPFLFLYVISLIQPEANQRRLFLHVFLSNILPLVPLILCRNSVVSLSIINSMAMINIMYLLTTCKILIVLVHAQLQQFGNWRVKSASWLLTFISMVMGALLMNLIVFITCPGRIQLLIQLPKGMIIFYTYYKILDSALIDGKHACGI